MEPLIQKILDDIYASDPSLREHEDALMRSLSALLREKPSIAVNAAFMKRLRRRVLSHRQNAPAARPWYTRAVVYGPLLGAFAVAILFVATRGTPAPTYVALQPNAGVSERSADTMSAPAQAPQAIGVAAKMNTAFSLTSSAFAAGGSIPAQFSCYGAATPIPVTVNNIPEGTSSLAFVMEDPDAPAGTFVHWVAFNIPPQNATVLPGALPSGGMEGTTSAGKPGYVAPCPPSGTHRYIITAYATDTVLLGSSKMTASDLRATLKDHILAEATLEGAYEK